MAVIFSLMVCSRVTDMTLYTDSHWIINIFDRLYNLIILEIEKSKVNYKV